MFAGPGSVRLAAGLSRDRERAQDVRAQGRLGRVDDLQIGPDVPLGRGDKQRVDRGPAGCGRGLGQPPQLPQQVGALPAQDLGQCVRVAEPGRGHHLEEKVVAVTALPHARLAQPAVQFRAPGRGELVHHAVRLDRLRLPLGGDQAVPGQPVEHLVQMPDVHPAPLVADRLLEAGPQFVAVRGLGGEQGEHGVLQRHQASGEGRVVLPSD